jgi:hypothetical protein
VVVLFGQLFFNGFETGGIDEWPAVQVGPEP